MARMNHNDYPALSAASLVHPVMFVVDMVNGFVRKGALADPAIAACAAPIAQLIETLDPDLWFVNDSHDEDCAEFSAFPAHCIRGSEEAQVIDELKDYPGRIIEKNAISAAAGEPYRQMLETLPERCDLIVTGCCTDLCVLQLALPLMSWIHQTNRRTCRVIVPADCVETYHSPTAHEAPFWNEAALANLAACGVEVVRSICAEPMEKKA